MKSDVSKEGLARELAEAVRGVGIAGKGPGVASRREWERVQAALAAYDEASRRTEGAREAVRPPRDGGEK